MAFDPVDIETTFFSDVPDVVNNILFKGDRTIAVGNVYSALAVRKDVGMRGSGVVVEQAAVRVNGALWDVMAMLFVDEMWWLVFPRHHRGDPSDFDLIAEYSHVLSRFNCQVTDGPRMCTGRISPCRREGREWKDTEESEKGRDARVDNFGDREANA